MVFDIQDAANSVDTKIDSVSQKINKLVNFDVPALPCGIDAQIFGIQSEILNTFNVLTSSFSPGNLISNLNALKLSLASTLSTKLATIITDQLPGRLPRLFQDDIFSLVQACSLGPTGADCKDRLSEISNRYKSFANADQAVNLILSLLGEESVDICSKIPNIQLFEDGTEGIFGLPAKLANVIPEIAETPSDLIDKLEVKATKIIDDTFKTHGDRFTK